MTDLLSQLKNIHINSLYSFIKLIDITILVIIWTFIFTRIWINFEFLSRCNQISKTIFSGTIFDIISLMQTLFKFFQQLFCAIRSKQILNNMVKFCLLFLSFLIYHGLFLLNLLLDFKIYVEIWYLQLAWDLWHFLVF